MVAELFVFFRTHEHDSYMIVVVFGMLGLTTRVVDTCPFLPSGRSSNRIGLLCGFQAIQHSTAYSCMVDPVSAECLSQ